MSNKKSLNEKIKIAIDHIEKNGDKSAIGVDNSLKIINKDLKNLNKEEYKEHKEYLYKLQEKLKNYKGKPIKKYKTEKEAFFREFDKLEKETTPNSSPSEKNSANKGKSNNPSLNNSYEKIKKEISSITKQFDSNFLKIEKEISNISSSSKNNFNSIKTKISDIHSSSQEYFNTIKTDISENNQRTKGDILLEIKNGYKKHEQLNDDILLNIQHEFKNNSKLSDIVQSTDVLPKKIDDLSTKIDNIGNENTTKKFADIPQDEKAIIELTQFMQDGLEQFENIAKYYIQKQTDFDQLNAEKNSMSERINNAKKEAGKNTEIKLARKLFSDFPSEFEKIQSVFGDIISSQYQEGQKIEVNSNNIQKLEISIEGIKEGTHEIMTADICIDKEVVKRATIKK